MGRQEGIAKRREPRRSLSRGVLASGLLLCDTGLDERVVRGACRGARRGWVGPALLLVAALGAGAGLRAWLAQPPAGVAAAPLNGP